MQKRKIYSRTLSQVITKRQQLELINQAEQVVDELYVKHKDPSLEHLIDELVGYQFSESLIQDYKESGMGVEVFFKGLIGELESMAEARLEIPLDLPKASLVRLSEKIFELMGKKYLLNISVNASVIAGVVVEIEGKHVDYSFDRLFDEKFELIRQIVAKKLS